MIKNKLNKQAEDFWPW